MSSQKDHTTPPAEDKDLLRYLNNEMSKEEKYAFEKNMEQDPFIYEAAEGLEGLSVEEIVADLHRVKKQLNRPKRLVGMVWKIAAAAALLVVGGMAAWRLTTPWPDQQVAEQEPTVGTTAADSLVATADLPLEEEVEEQAAAGAGAAEPQPATSEVSGTTSASEPPVQTPQVAEAGEQQVTGNPTANDASGLFAEADEVEVFDDVLTDREEVLDLSIADDAEKKEIVAEPVPQEVTAPKLTEFNAVAASASEADSAPKKVSAARTSAGGVSRSAAPPSLAYDVEGAGPVNASPVGGWEAFTRYVRENQQKSADMVAGKVFLTFTVGPQGQPQNISVLKSLCAACDREAIRLLSNSGAWQYNGSVTGTPSSTVVITIER